MGMVAIFTYGFPIATEAFAKAGVTLDTLSNYETMIPLAAAEGYVSEDDMAFLQEWRKAPDKF
jgi:orotate phosphoribosyltransferase